MEFEAAKHILQSVRDSEGEFFPRDYNMNLYRGCGHGCIYCDARSRCYQLDRPDVPRPKADALMLLEQELRGKRKTGVVGLGGMSDGYNPLEAECKLTRGALALLLRYGFGIGVTTKSPLVARDADLLRAILRYAPAHVTFSITASDDALSRKLEPNVAPSSERFAALRVLADAGVPAGVWINPVLPFLTDTEENLLALLEMAKAAGASYAVTHYGMTLRDGNREPFYAALDRDFPGLKQRYIKAFGNAYFLDSPRYETLHPVYEAACKRLGLAFTFREISARIRESGGFRQEKLF